MMNNKLLFALAFLLVSLSSIAQTRKMEEEFFPEPDINIPTPAFQKSELLGFTKYKEMVKYVTNLASKLDYVTVDQIGESQKGKPIIRVHINKPTKTEKVKVWMQAGLHGNEPASTEGALFLLHDLITNPDYAHLLNRVELMMLPMANADGYNNQNRYSANGLDLNRDYIKLAAPETNAIRTAFSKFSPEVSVDFHEYNPYRAHFSYFGEKGITSYYDAFFLFSGNLNVNHHIRETTKDLLVKNAKHDLQENGRHVSDYSSTKMKKGHIHFNRGGSSPRSSATNYALNNCHAILMEIRGVNLKRISFKRRVQTTYLAGMSYLQTSYDNVAQIKSSIQRANQATVTLEDSVVTDMSKAIIKTKYTCIDLVKEEKVDIDVVMTDGLEMTANEKRERPYAYILMPEESKAAQKLEVLGCEVIQLEKAKTVNVEAYHVTKRNISLVKWEQIYMSNVKAETKEVQKEFPKGSFIIYMTQKNANILPSTLEPENDNSFFSFRVIETSLEEELPVYRYMKKEKI